MNGAEHPGVPKEAAQQQMGAQEISVDVQGAGPGGGAARLAMVLISPTRFYVDIKNPKLLQDSILLASGQGNAQSRRNSLHQLFERWMLVVGGASLAEAPANDAAPKPDPEPVPKSAIVTEGA